MSENFVFAADLEAIKTGKMFRVKLENYDILLANVDGEIYAVDNLCSHEDAILYNGALKGRCVECPLHGSRFDLASGRPLEEPATVPIRTYPVRIESNRVYVGL